MGLVEYLEDVWGEPRYYRNIAIHPIKMKDALKFNKYVTSLNIPKNTIDDPEIIRMTYIKFLLVMATLDDSFKKVLENFIELLKLVLNAELIEFYQTDDGKRIIISVDNSFEIRESEFDKIKSIIAEQNLIELEDDKYLNPEFRQKLLEAKKFRERKNKKSAPLDEQIFIYRCFSGESYEKIKELTIYQFTNELKRYAQLKESDILQNAYYSGYKEFKDGFVPPSWMDKLQESKDDLVIDAESFISKAQKDLGSNK